MHLNISSSRLVSLLHECACEDAKTSRQDWAERLSLWLDPFDAITLHAAHQAMKAATAEKPRPAHLTTACTLDEEFRRVRADLVTAMTTHASSRSRDIRAKNLHPEPEPCPETDAGYAPYRQRYLAHQRQMALKIEALRAHCRQVLAQTSVRLQQLTDLDVALEQTLGAREKALLSKVPALLERRFEHWRKSQRDGLLAAQPQDVPAVQQKPQGGMAMFDQEFEAVVLAELSFRLEPVAGLVEAFSNEA